MRSNRKIIFGLFLILGAVGFYRAFQYLSGLNSVRSRVATENTAANAGEPNLQNVSTKNVSGRVAKARVNIPANSIVTPDMLRMAAYEGPSTDGFVTDIDSQAEGFITRVDIPANATIRPQYDFVGHISETGIAGLLRPGTRAMVVPLANKPTLHELVRIGNYVDVLAAFDGQESRTIIQNVRVLGVDVSANDYPNVSAAMRGGLKAAPKQNGIRSAEEKANAEPTPTPAPNAPRPDPAVTLEVTPRQAAALQLAIASNSTLDYLVRPALPGNRSSEVAPIAGGEAGTAGTGTPGAAQVQTVSVTKAQIAPYAERRKNVGGARSSANGSGGGNAPLLPRGGRRPLFVDGPAFPTSGQIPPAVPPVSTGTGTGAPITIPPPVAPVPTPTQNYTIPIYGDGKIMRTETVPLPDPSR